MGRCACLRRYGQYSGMVPLSVGVNNWTVNWRVNYLAARGEASVQSR
jgi:hypothetical protein